MIEAFERHLKAAAFTRDVEKCETDEQRVEFCKKFLTDKGFYVIDKANVATTTQFATKTSEEFLEDHLKSYATHYGLRTTLHVKKEVPFYAIHTVPNETIISSLAQQIGQDIFAQKLVKLHQESDMAKQSRLFSAIVEVIAP